MRKGLNYGTDDTRITLIRYMYFLNNDNTMLWYKINEKKSYHPLAW